MEQIIGSTIGTSRYGVKKRIGSGGFGEALLVKKEKTSEMFVAKRVHIEKQNKHEIEKTMKEVELLSKFSDHPFIVRYHEAWVKFPYLYVIMDYCEKGDLQHQIDARRRAGKFLSEDQVMKYFTQVAAAVHHMHRNHVLHRDIKLANILLDGSNKIQVTDFGISRHLASNDVAKTHIGTPSCMSPESLKGEPYSYPSDVWSLGCVLYNMLALHPPFNALCMVGLLRAIKSDAPPPLPRAISNSVTQLCTSMLDKNPARRPTIDEVMRNDRVKKALTTLMNKR
eukprot:GHVS01021796.1.p1 GENE.GHVS01021796.1~~GHVS01021796.1.p1  ORF type:complete len:282 (+),score=39.26 GHVS01021796.1:85-930(+)